MPPGRVNSTFTGPATPALFFDCSWIITANGTQPLSILLNEWRSALASFQLSVFDGDSIYSPIVISLSKLQQVNRITVSPSTLALSGTSLLLVSYSVLPYNVPTSAFLAPFTSFMASNYLPDTATLSVTSSPCGNNCSSHGVCVQSACMCSDGWSGPQCQAPLSNLTNLQAVQCAWPNASCAISTVACPPSACASLLQPSTPNALLVRCAPNATMNVGRAYHSATALADALTNTSTSLLVLGGLLPSVSSAPPSAALAQRQRAQLVARLNVSTLQWQWQLNSSTPNSTGIAPPILFDHCSAFVPRLVCSHTEPHVNLLVLYTILVICSLIVFVFSFTSLGFFSRTRVLLLTDVSWPRMTRTFSLCTCRLACSCSAA